MTGGKNNQSMLINRTRGPCFGPELGGQHLTTSNAGHTCTICLFEWRGSITSSSASIFQAKGSVGVRPDPLLNLLLLPALRLVYYKSDT